VIAVTFRLVCLPLLISSPRSLYIKGATDEEAVLCTKKKTYSVRQVNLSNSLLLASQSQDDTLPVYNIKDTQFSTIELSPCLPRIEKLDTILNPTMYTGPENENTVQAKVNGNAYFVNCVS
jgi:sister chromatid cohesion protein DCC1